MRSRNDNNAAALGSVGGRLKSEYLTLGEARDGIHRQPRVISS